MKELCEEHGAELVLLVSPVPAWTMEDYQAIRSAAEEMDLIYLDLNKDASLTDIDAGKDFADASHLNVYGADKETKYIGEFLKKEYHLDDHRGDAKYGRWDEDYRYYIDYLETLPTER